MDDFTVFLIIGLLMIAAMVIIFTGEIGLIDLGDFGTSGNNHYYNGGGHYYYYNGSKSTTTTTVQTINPNDTLIGPENVTVWRTIGPTAINASYTASNSGYAINEKYLYNGLLFGSQGIEIYSSVDTKDLMGGYISFDIDRANGYGGLVIKINGHVLNDQKLYAGSYNFIIDKSLVQGTNKIEIYPASSFWRTWAPNIYYIKNFDFSLQSQYSKPAQIKFNIYKEEYDRLTKDKGRLLLDLQDHKGFMKINLNGNEIYSNQSSGYQAIYFDQKNLRSGENTLDIYAMENSQFQGLTSLMFYYQTTRENSFEYIFEITDTRYKYLNTSWGAIRFNVTNIQKQGGITVGVYSSNNTRTAYYYDMLRSQEYAMFFNATQATKGWNTVKINSVDNATFYVNNVRVEV